MATEDFAKRLARIEERARKGQKAEFAPLPEHPDEKPRKARRRGLFSGLFGRVVLPLAVVAGVATFYSEQVGELVGSDLLASDNPFASMIRSQMTESEIVRMEADPDLSIEKLRAQGHANPELARLLLSN